MSNGFFTTAPSTIVNYPLNGQVEFTIPFEFLARKFVVVTLIGTSKKVLTLGTDYRFVAVNKIQLTKQPDGSFTNIEIRRVTSASDRIVSFVDGSILRAYDLNIAQVQTMHVAEEARDLAGTSIVENDDGNLDARGRRIVNVLDGVDSGDAVNVSQLKSTESITGQNADSAKTSAKEAKDSEIAAANSEASCRASEAKCIASAGTAMQAAADAAYSADIVINSAGQTTRLATELAKEDSEVLVGAVKAGIIAKRVGGYFDVSEFGAKGDGVSDDTLAFHNAISAMNLSRYSLLRVPAGKYILSENITLNGITLEGDGVDYWDTWRPDENRRLKSWSHGTHLVFKGTGSRTKEFLNISNERPTKTINGVACDFTNFTNNDSVGTSPASTRKFSVGVTLMGTSAIKNLRIMLNHNGIDGYNDFNTTSIGDDWDIGLHLYDSAESEVYNVQVVGYWRVAGTLLTENDGSFSMKGNPERTVVTKLLTQGIRGLLIRNCPQIDVISRSADTVTFKENKTLRITAQNTFKLSGSAQTYTFSGATTSGGNITLTGVTPSMSPQNTASVIRFPSMGNNWSGTCFNDTVTCSFEHSSRKSSDELGLPIAFALEIDGYPCRNLKFINFKAQTTFDKGNTLFGDMRDAKFVASEFENGVMVAYDHTETQGYTGNLRMILSDIQSSTNKDGFTPRDCFYDLGQFPTMFTDGTAVFKNWRQRDLSVQWYNEADAFRLNEADGSLKIGASDGSSVFTYNSTKDIVMKSRNMVFQTTDGSEVVKWFGGSGNISFKGIGMPFVDNSKSWGTGSSRWSVGFFVQGVQTTSDARLKTAVRPFTENELKAASELADGIGFFGWLAEGSDRLHCGTTVQHVIDVLKRHSLNPFDYGFVCHDKWDDEVDEHGIVTRKAGDMYSLRDHEFYKFLVKGLSNRLSNIENILRK